MKKETKYEKMVKRFYGITGPLDEQKRHVAEKLGNTGFIWFFYILIIGNFVAILLGAKFPTIMVWAYPLFLEAGLFIILGWISFQGRKHKLGAIDEGMLSKKENRQLKYIGLKSGIYFGLSMFFLMPLNQMISEGGHFYTYLLSKQNILNGLIQSILFGVAIQLVIYFRRRDAREDTKQDKD